MFFHTFELLDVILVHGFHLQLHLLAIALLVFIAISSMWVSASIAGAGMGASNAVTGVAAASLIVLAAVVCSAPEETRAEREAG